MLVLGLRVPPLLMLLISSLLFLHFLMPLMLLLLWWWCLLAVGLCVVVGVVGVVVYHRLHRCCVDDQ